jgi:hypothetical protein
MLEQVLEMAFSSQIFLTPGKPTILKSFCSFCLGTADNVHLISLRLSCVCTLFLHALFLNFPTDMSNSHMASDRVKNPAISFSESTMQAAIELLTVTGGYIVFLEEQVFPVLIT